MGCDTFAIGHFPDDEVARSCRLNDDEWPMLIVRVSGRPIPIAASASDENPIWSEGEANELSAQRVEFPMMDAIHGATKIIASDRDIAIADPGPIGLGNITLPTPASFPRTFGDVVRSRRSALDFRGGVESMSLGQLSAILTVTAQPLSADFATTRFVQLYLYVHRVDGLDSGVYRYWPENHSLEHIRSGDQRIVAAGLSLGQDLAGNACVAFSMIADLDRATRAHGDRGYRYAHFEAGAIGHRLYLAAEALGLGATGIGAFFDDQVHRYLDIAPEQGQVVYHFAIGYPVTDPRMVA